MALKIFLFFVALMNVNANFLKYHREGEQGSLNCSAPEGVVQYWLIRGTGEAIYEEGDFSKDVYMSENGTLIFTRVNKTLHEGTHQCIVDASGTTEAFSVEMRVKPLPSENLWETRYKQMFVRGLISAVVAFMVFFGAGFVQKYKWMEPLTKIEEAGLVNGASPYTNGTTNKGMDQPDGGYMNKAMDQTDEAEDSIEQSKM